MAMLNNFMNVLNAAILLFELRILLSARYFDGTNETFPNLQMKSLEGEDHGSNVWHGGNVDLIDEDDDVNCDKQWRDSLATIWKFLTS